MQSLACPTAQRATPSSSSPHTRNIIMGSAETSPPLHLFSSPSFLPSFLLHLSFTHSHHTAATYKYPNHSQLFPPPSPPHFLSPESPESPQTVTSAGGWGRFLRQRDGDGVLSAVSRLQLRFYSPLIREPCERQRERR